MSTRNVYYCNYSIGSDVYGEVPSVCGLFGKKILLIGGRKALAAGKDRLLSALEGNLSVCPGHGEISTLDAERSYNPYVLQALRSSAE